jgi:ribose transport system substrate-binding protein
MSSQRGILDKGLTVLEAVERASAPLTIQEVAARTGFQRLAVARILQTLELRGYVRRGEDRRYSATLRRHRPRIGYFGPLRGNQFRVAVADSLRRAAAERGVDLTLLDHAEDDADAAAAHAHTLAGPPSVDVAIFFEPQEPIGHRVGSILFEAHVPFITVERPIDGGIYFGANNFQAGKLAGETLGRHAASRWAGRFDHLVLLEGPPTTTTVQARLAGVLVGLRSTLGGEDAEARVVHLEGGQHEESSREAMAVLLKGLPGRARLLVAGFNDLAARGALEAVRAAGRETHVAIVGHNAASEGRAALRRPGSPLIASIAFFPERYGARLIQLAESLIAGEPVPPAVYTDHRVLHAGNVDALYPGEPH